MSYFLLRRVLFRLDAETAHHLALGVMSRAGWLAPLVRRLCAVQDPRLAVEAFGMRFVNPLGLAAGFDKAAQAVTLLSGLGFGHVELGTVTLHPQAGNPRPRLLRLPVQRALINRMGFPNPGVEVFLRNLSSARCGDTRIGINIGKGKDTPLERAAEDYVALLRRVHGAADYVAVNVSSPNTTGLRALQAEEQLTHLLEALNAARDALPRRVPLLLKIAPDLTPTALDALLETALAQHVDGIIATNTTIARDGLPTGLPEGGLSGAPLATRATAIVRHIARRTQGQLPIIGVGGVMNAADALEKLRAGAWLVQLYTGFVYAGPLIARHINLALLRAMEREGVEHIKQLRRL